MGKDVKIAIIGTGNMGRKYAQMILNGEIEGSRLTCAVCRSEDAYNWGMNLGGFEIYRSEEELFSHREEFDALIITTPHKLHPSQALKAFELNKHVMCDKPAAVELKDAKMMSETANKKGLVYGLMFHHRLREDYNELKKIIDEGRIGKIFRIQATNTRYFRTAAYHNSSSWRSTLAGEGGGALINQGQHFLDIWQWLFGMPEKIQSLVMTGKYNNFDVEDEATILMKYADGKTGCFIISTAEGMYEDRLVVSGSKGFVELNGNEMKITEFSEDTDEYRKNHSCNSREELTERREVKHFKVGADRELYVKMLQNFANSIIYKEKLIAPGDEGIYSLMLTKGSYLSEKTEKRIDIKDL